MRLDVNLASQPYEDARQFWMRWGTAVGALGLLTLVLLALDATGYIAASHDRIAMSQKRDMIAERDQIRMNAEQYLSKPENRTTRDQSQYLNQLIERKAFSWTRVLENLEKVMPPRVHVQSISPQLNDDNELALKMVVAGDSRDRAIELMERMEESRSFTQTQITAERNAQAQNGDTEQIEIAAIYIPEPEAAATPAPATTGQNAGDAKSKTPVLKAPVTKGLPKKGPQH
jgi:type IV pilus assembly protein PilN